MSANNYFKEIEKIIEKGNNRFIEIVETDRQEEKLMLDFFRERYTHFIHFKFLRENKWNVIWEEKTELKFIRTGQTPKSGNHDLVVLNENNRPIAGFEFFLGYVVGDSPPFSYNSFKTHLNDDYQKLVKSNMKAAYLLNYIYKGSSPRSSEAYTRKMEVTYQNHLSNCIMECEELVSKHKKSITIIGITIRIIRIFFFSIYSL